MLQISIQHRHIFLHLVRVVHKPMAGIGKLNVVVGDIVFLQLFQQQKFQRRGNDFILWPIGHQGGDGIGVHIGNG